MGKSTTKSDRRRFEDLQQIGCIACLMEMNPGVPCQIHHAVDQAYRRGHQATAGLCPWHHVGELPPGVDPEVIRVTHGPSLKLHGRAFRLRYGTDADLVARADAEIARLRAATVGGREDGQHSG